MVDTNASPPASTNADQALHYAGLNLRSLFDRIPFAVQVFSFDGQPLYANAAYRDLWGYADDHEPSPDKVIFESPPLNAMGLMPYIRRGFAGETIALPPTRYTVEEVPTIPDGRPRWIRTILYPIADEGSARRAVVVMHIDVTEREEAQQILEERVEERTHELATLLQVSQRAAATLDLGALLDVILEQLKVVADFSGSTIAVLEDGDQVRILDDRGGVAPDQPNPELIGRLWPLADGGAVWQSIMRRQPVIIGDAHGDEPLARDYRKANRSVLDSPAISHVRSWLAVPLVFNDRVIGMISISKDEPGFYTPHHAQLALAIATHAAAAIENARLFERERRATQELSALLEISRNVSSTLDLQPLLGLVLDQMKRIVDYTSATVLTREGEHAAIREYRGPLPREVVLSRPIPVRAFTEMLAVARSDAPLIIPDIWAETPVARAYRATRGEEYLRTTAAYLRALLSVPLVHKGEVVGSLALTHHTPGYFTAHHASLTQAVADQVAGAIENARLFEEQRRTASELSSLLEVSRDLSSTLELEPLLNMILDQVKTVSEYDGASVVMVEGDFLRPVCRRAPTEVDPTHEIARGVPRERGGPTWDYILRRRPVIIADVRADEPLARSYRSMFSAPLEQSALHYIRAWMGVPLLVNNRAIGMIVLAHGEPDFYTERHAALVSAIANQAAAAIENARLFEQARRLAALEERQRLARELHDSVSQVLFSIGLGARTARTLLDRGDPDRAAPSVEYILNLAEMGMAEMRALLFELRPESLEQEGLVAALTKQAAALRARHSIEVDATLCDEPEIRLDVKEALYRIAQEAMHNTVKHARASRITVTLSCDAEAIVMTVVDNGRGFDPSGSFPGHLGLRSMRERVSRFDGTVQIESAPERGTAVGVRIPVRPR